VSDEPQRRLREIAAAREDSYRMAADVVVDALGSIEEVAYRVEAACSGS
jgi:shikimate kinase